MRQVRYRDIAGELRRMIVDGQYAPAAVLPSENDLGVMFSASRVTIRKALEVLRSDGLVDSRQGFGWFVAARPLRQELVTLGTIEDQLSADGRTSDRRVITFGFVPATGRVADILEVDEVLRVRRLNLADGAPFARVTVWCPVDLADEVSRADVERRSFISLLPVPLAGATQTIGAAGAEADDAGLLGIPEGAPVLRMERTTHDTSGRIVLLAEHVFPAHRTEYVVELPVGHESMSPSGVRLLGASLP